MFGIRLFFLVCLSYEFSIYAGVKTILPIVVSKIRHETPAFTQGLAIEGDQLFESTGLYGESSLRRLNISSGEVLQKKNLSKEFFGEGLAVFPNHIYQISWKEEKAFVYDREGFQLEREISYFGEGWGLCRDGETIWMSNGSSVLTQRDPKTFAILKTVHVRIGDNPIEKLNDLECVGDYLYANVWLKNLIVKIEKETGEVESLIDCSHLLLPELNKRMGHLLNGIAFRATSQTFFVTGKEWPWIYEIKL